jgi:hypothetical protein
MILTAKSWLSQVTTALFSAISTWWSDHSNFSNEAGAFTSMLTIRLVALYLSSGIIMLPKVNITCFLTCNRNLLIISSNYLPGYEVQDISQMLFDLQKLWIIQESHNLEFNVRSLLVLSAKFNKYPCEIGCLRSIGLTISEEIYNMYKHFCIIIFLFIHYLHVNFMG